MTLLLSYSLLSVVIVYRYIAMERPSILFHSMPPLSGITYDKWTQIRETVFHVLIFLSPGLLAFAFNRPPRSVQPRA